VPLLSQSPAVPAASRSSAPLCAPTGSSSPSTTSSPCRAAADGSQVSILSLSVAGQRLLSINPTVFFFLFGNESHQRCPTVRLLDDENTQRERRIAADTDWARTHQNEWASPHRHYCGGWGLAHMRDRAQYWGPCKPSFCCCPCESCYCVLNLLVDHRVEFVLGCVAYCSIDLAGPLGFFEHSQFFEVPSNIVHTPHIQTSTFSFTPSLFAQPPQSVSFSNCFKPNSIQHSPVTNYPCILPSGLPHLWAKVPGPKLGALWALLPWPVLWHKP